MKKLIALFCSAALIMCSVCGSAIDVNRDPNSYGFMFEVKPLERAEPIAETQEAQVEQMDFSSLGHGLIHKNLVTGETSFIPLDEEQTMMDYLNCTNTEPQIPDGIEIAPLPDPTASTNAAPKGTRNEITNINAYPYSAIAYLNIEFGNNTGTGTGSFIGGTTLLTAAHVVCHPVAGDATKITVYPGGLSSSFGNDVVCDMYVPSEWKYGYSEKYDYAIIMISTDLGTGCFATKAETTENLANRAIYAYGYPGDKPAGTLWYDSGNVGPLPANQFFTFDAYVTQGQSGGPIVLQSDYRYIVGIISREVTSGGQSTKIATRVTREIMNLDLKYS